MKPMFEPRLHSHGSRAFQRQLDQDLQRGVRARPVRGQRGGAPGGGRLEVPGARPGQERRPAEVRV